MNKFKCNGCGKIHSTNTGKCDCETNDKGFTEVIVEKVVEKEEVNLEELKAKWAEEAKAGLDKQLEDEKAKLLKDAEASESEKLKAQRAKWEAEAEEDAKLSEEQKKLKEQQKQIDVLLENNAEYKKNMDMLLSAKEEDSKKFKRLALKDEISDLAKDKPWMVDLVKVEFESGRINSTEEYDKLVESFYGKQAKEAYDLKEQSKTWGQDPANTYKQSKVSAKESKTGLSEEAKARVEKRLARAGFKSIKSQA